MTVWRERGREADIVCVCVQALEKFAGAMLTLTTQDKKNHAGDVIESKLDILLEMYEKENVIAYLVWTLQTHFFRTEHLMVALGIVAIFMRYLHVNLSSFVVTNGY